MHLIQLTAGKKDDFNIAHLPETIQLVREQKYWCEQQCYTLSQSSANLVFPQSAGFLIPQVYNYHVIYASYHSNTGNIQVHAGFVRPAAFSNPHWRLYKGGVPHFAQACQTKQFKTLYMKGGFIRPLLLWSPSVAAFQNHFILYILSYWILPTLASIKA